MSSNTLNLAIRTDCALVDASAATERFVELAITAAKAPAREDRPPLNIALIIDRSGSMAGEKLSFVKQAACHVLDLLSEPDRVALVAYDDEVLLLAPSQRATLENRKAMRKSIEALRDGGSTDLAGGWLRGAAEVAEWLMDEGVNRALLLTDGLANHGLTDPEEIVKHARELNSRRVSTSTFGVGIDFNEHLLSRMAEHGGGHFYFIESPKQIPGVFRRELGELLATVARDAALDVYTQEGVEAELLGGLPAEKKGGRIRIPLGDLFAGQQRNVYFRLQVPAGVVGSRVELHSELTYLGEDGRETDRIKAVLLYAPSGEVASAPRIQEVVDRAAEVDLAHAEAEALIMERSGDYAGATTSLKARACAYAALAPQAAAPVSQRADDLASGLTELERKTRLARSHNTRHTRK